MIGFLYTRKNFKNFYDDAGSYHFENVSLMIHQEVHIVAQS